jgi:imidazolonepropionase-like amidohydrolase
MAVVNSGDHAALVSYVKVIQHATQNNARILGMEDRIGRVRAGHLTDLIVVNGNPPEGLKVLYATGTETIRDGKAVRSGGIEWTIKDVTRITVRLCCAR